MFTCPQRVTRRYQGVAAAFLLPGGGVAANKLMSAVARVAVARADLFKKDRRLSSVWLGAGSCIPAIQ